MRSILQLIDFYSFIEYSAVKQDGLNMKSKESPVSVPRSVKREQIKEHIYKVAMQLLKEYGYEYITVKNICTMADVSTGSFYHYFKSKDDLISNFFLEAYAKFSQEGKLKPGEDTIENILQFFFLYSDFCQEQGLDFIRNFYTPFNRSMDMNPAPKAGGKCRLPSLLETERYITEAQEKGVLSDRISAGQLADDLCTIEKGCIYEWCVTNGEFRIRDLVERLLRNYLSSYIIQKT